MDQRIIDLYDDYTHARLDRRIFMRRLSKLAGSGAAAAALLPMLEASRAKAAIVPADDDRLVTERVTYPGATGDVAAYLAKPADAGGPLPSVVVIHENRGLNPHIEDVARRIALEGFVALAPDALSPLGGTPEDADRAREMIGQLDQGSTVDNYVRAVSHLEGRDDTTDRVGAVGFCWGGGMIGLLATASDDLDAGVVFYGRVPPLDRVPDIRAPLLLHYAGLDERINADVPAFEEALKAAGADYTMHMYEGANHAFHNDTSEARYDPDAARLAFERTIEFFNQNLKREA
ncbi:MAG TPA: dienelactone hydrolase family protein [Geminicoccaceae bacterium]|nr:dienelactone hydrolase family protein [Geminicoccaceae bacterium]